MFPARGGSPLRRRSSGRGSAALAPGYPSGRGWAAGTWQGDSQGCAPAAAALREPPPPPRPLQWRPAHGMVKGWAGAAATDSDLQWAQRPVTPPTPRPPTELNRHKRVEEHTLLL